MRAPQAGAEGRAHRGLLGVRDRIGDVVGARLVAEVELLHRPRELVVERLAHDTVVDPQADLRAARGTAHDDSHQERERQERGAREAPHGRPPGAAGGRGASAGAGSTGGYRCPSSALDLVHLDGGLGLVADTGTKPTPRHV
jgi:hypothetical protein